MRNKILAVLATGALLAGCECTPSNTEIEVNQMAVKPGTAADFKQNTKDRVFFAFNKAAVTPESKNILEAQAGWFKTYPATSAVIEGHCDARGTREYNLALGQKRAHAAMTTLNKLGVATDRLKAVSYGKDRPLVEGTTEEAYAQNRTAITDVN